MIKAIQTRYAGCHFRSRLEARWAVFMDHLGIGWEYEPEGFETSAGPYLPDFKVNAAHVQHFAGDAYGPGTAGEVYLEVKGDTLSQHDAERIRAFACDPGERWVIALGPVPEPPQEHLLLTGWGQGTSGCWIVNPGGTLYCMGTPTTGFRGVTVASAMDAAFRYTRPICSNDCPCAKGAVNQALTAARSARFEHGQSGVG